MTKRRTTPKQLIAAYNDTAGTLKAVADVVGLTRERVRQLTHEDPAVKAAWEAAAERRRRVRIVERANFIRKEGGDCRHAGIDRRHPELREYRRRVRVFVHEWRRSRIPDWNPGDARKGRGDRKFTDAAMFEALRKTMGNVKDAGVLIGCSRALVVQRMRRNPKLAAYRLRCLKVARSYPVIRDTPRFDEQPKAKSATRRADAG